MRITEARTFDEYWVGKEFFDKRPVRNGSRVMMVGDNIYHREMSTGEWLQLDSHHSHPDGTPNRLNIDKDTRADRVLISREFFYFGRNAPTIPSEILSALGYKNKIGHWKFSSVRGRLLEWILKNHGADCNFVVGDPFDFDHTDKRYSGRGKTSGVPTHN
jgi:hypothetical protein